MNFLNQLRRALISAFVLISITTILVINRTDPVISTANKYVVRHLLPPVLYSKGVQNFFIYYAAYTGLDPRWTMFGRTQVYDWWHVIKAEYANSEIVVLPIPTQSPRTVLQRIFFDYKEVKFHVNIHQSLVGQQAYASYLCRQYPSHEGSPIRSITMEVQWATHYGPYEAKVRGSHVMPGTGTKLLGVYQCSHPQV